MPDGVPFTDRFLTLAALTVKIGMGKSSIYRMMDSGSFPRPRQVGEVAVRWLESEVDAWMMARPTAGIEPGIGGDTDRNSHANTAS